VSLSAPAWGKVVGKKVPMLFVVKVIKEVIVAVPVFATIGEYPEKVMKTPPIQFENGDRFHEPGRH